MDTNKTAGDMALLYPKTVQAACNSCGVILIGAGAMLDHLDNCKGAI